MKVLIQRILNLNGSWQGYRLCPNNAYGEPTWSEPGKQFSFLNDIIDFYQLQNVRELGTRYYYDNKDQKYGVEEYEAILN